MNTIASTTATRIIIDPKLGQARPLRPPRKGQVALTFDDGPHPVQTPIILDVLDRYGIKANFFLLGCEAEKYPELVSEICRRDHIVGSHSYSHPDLTALKPAQAKAEILRGHEAVRRTSRTLTPFFRFPYFYFTEELESFVWQHELVHVLSNINSHDWSAKTPGEVVAKTVDGLNADRNGVILLHDPVEVTARALPTLIEELSKTVRFVFFDWLGPHQYNANSSEPRDERPGTANGA